MKILFLDIDGVVNNRFTPMTGGFGGFDPYMCLLVNRICEQTGAKIVVSSSWRLHPDSLNEVHRKIFPKPIDVTPRHDCFEDRGAEIAEWLYNHHEVTKYAILDDFPYAGEGHGKSFFQTSFETGLTEEIAQQVIQHLGSITTK